MPIVLPRDFTTDTPAIQIGGVVPAGTIDGLKMVQPRGSGSAGSGAGGDPEAAPRVEPRGAFWRLLGGRFGGSWGALALTVALGCGFLGMIQTALAQGGPRGAGAFGADDLVERVELRDLESVARQLEVFRDRPTLRAVGIPTVELEFDTRGPLPRHEVILALESLLSINGIAVVSVGNFMKLVPAGEVQRHAPEILTGSLQGLPPSLAFYTKLFEFDVLNARTEAAPLIQSVMSNPGNIIGYPKANAMLLTDNLVNLQRIEVILGEADRTPEDPSAVFFLTLKNIAATDLAGRLQALLLRPDSSASLPFLNNTSIEADERSNQLLIVTHPNNRARIEELVRRLDVDVEPQTNHASFYLKHAEEATQVAGILNSLIEGQRRATEAASGRSSAAANTARESRRGREEAAQQVEAAPAAPAVDPGAGVVTTAAGRENLAFSSFVNVVADERANAIHATGTAADLRTVADLIAKIDVPLPQVRIEVVIADVSLSKGQSSGLQSFGFETGPNGVIDFSSLAFGGLTATDLVVPTSGKVLSNIDLALVVGASRTGGNVNILATPTILTQHNKEASIIVTEQRPLVSGTTTSGDTVTSNVNYRDVGITLDVKPLIGNDGQIQLEITQTSDNFGSDEDAVTVNGTPQVPILRREASSFVSLRDGETIVLGGLRSREVRNDRSRLFLLGDLPILGPLFQPENNSANETELIIFIRPTVITSSAVANRLTDDALTSLGDTGDALRDFYETDEFPEATLPPYDPFKLKEVLGLRDRAASAGESGEATQRPKLRRGSR